MKFTYKYLEDEWVKGYWNFIQNNQDKGWDWNDISRNPNITWEIIQNNPGKNWNWGELSYHPNITWDIIQNNLDKEWDWVGISCNPNITWENIQNNPDLTYAKLDKQFPKSCQGNLGVFATIEDANEIFVRTNRHRYFDKPEECITLSDSSIAVCSQWGGNINQFLKQAESLGYDIKIKSN